MQPTYRPAGDTGLVVEFEERIDPAILERVRALDNRIAEAGIPGVVETVPTYRSILVLLDPLRTRPDEVEAAVRALDSGTMQAAHAGHRVWRIPVAYGGAFGADFDEVAERTGLSGEALRDLHSGAEYTVYMIGFAPGFAYLGGLPDRLHLSRRASPRTKVPAGAVAIGGQQAAVFSVEMPSGWHLLGRTPVRAFAPERADPFLFRQGDRIRFAPIEAETFHALADREARGEAVADLLAP
ncbi:MAG TPA: 5-oxoprolinase subunit PxpB [Azospirillaceae bacterium]|nr:5-oxoprolinase subunit PxpB [Azospirillaceae bacterium]